MKHLSDLVLYNDEKVTVWGIECIRIPAFYSAA